MSVFSSKTKSPSSKNTTNEFSHSHYCHFLESVFSFHLDRGLLLSASVQQVGHHLAEEHLQQVPHEVDQRTGESNSVEDEEDAEDDVEISIGWKLEHVDNSAY